MDNKYISNVFPVYLYTSKYKRLRLSFYKNITYYYIMESYQDDT